MQNKNELKRNHRHNLSLQTISQVLSVVLLVTSAVAAMFVNDEYLQALLLACGMVLSLPMVTEWLVFKVARRATPR